MMMHRSVKQSEQLVTRTYLSDEELIELANTRWKYGISTKEMAYRLKLPVTTFNNYECGARRPPATVVTEWRRELALFTE